MFKKIIIVIAYLFYTKIALAGLKDEESCGYFLATTEKEFMEIIHSVKQENLTCLQYSEDANDLIILATLYDQELLNNKVDEGTIIALMEKSANKGNYIGQTYYGNYLIKIGEYDDGMRFLGKAADAGYSTAENALGINYISLGNIELGISWVKKSADGNDPDALKNLALFYYNGTILEKNIPLSVSLFNKSAEAGSASSQRILGGLYTGKVLSEVLENPEKAFYWTKKSVDNGHKPALSNLAKFYETGYGVEQNMELAFQLLTQSADSGSIWGQYNLAYFYIKNMQEENFEKALYLFKKVANKFPMMTLGNCKEVDDLACYKEQADSVINFYIENSKDNIVFNAY